MKARKPTINPPVTRPTSWWLATLRRRAATMYQERPDFSDVRFDSERERLACFAFFNAAFRAEESGLMQAHRLADEVRAWDPELAECLVLYGNEEGWHRELLTGFLRAIGGEVRPMGRVVRTLYRAYGRAKHMESIMLTNLMFETIGATTYRIALGRVRQPGVRNMLGILTRDESFHVPLNVHFIREVLRHQQGSAWKRLKLRGIYEAVFAALIASTLASRPEAEAFDHISWKELAVAYAENLGRLFLHEPDLRFEPPWVLLRLLGLDREQLAASPDHVTSVAAAEAAARREDVQVSAL